ncbi:nucleolar protein 10-like [Styela clava]
MQVTSPNSIKIYNLSSGNSLPQFLSQQKKRALLKKDVSLRRRIELIQDFTMPTVCTSVQMTRDGNYVFVAGTYKPRIRCFDVNQLSLKFERCLDAEVVSFEVLSEDYSKIVMLLNDRYVEFHSQEGRWYRVRMPKFGRHMKYYPGNCDLYLVGTGPEIYRLNLDLGRYYQSFKTNALELNVCDINDHHHLLAVGTSDGKIECWDPRSRQRVGILDCAMSAAEENKSISACPEVTALKFKGPLHMSVGMSNGQILMYDIRANKPYSTKDHYYDLPIHSIAFNDENGLVISSDQRCVKLWDEKTGTAVTALEPENDINQLHLVNNSGLIFLASECTKVQTYFIPMLGPAPKWASFLDNLTEELEENPAQEIYDDYKFVTEKELENLGLSNLIGSSLLRAYMHGYFMDIRLYHKAKAIANPFAYNDYRQKKIKEKMEETRANRVQIKKLPKVNKGLAERLLHHTEDTELKSGKRKKQKREAEGLLADSRFKAMFENPEFEINEESEEFQLLNPVVTKQLEKNRKKSEKVKVQREHSSSEDSEVEGKGSDESSSEDDDKSKWIKDVKSVHKKLYRKTLADREERSKADAQIKLEPQLYQIKSGIDFSTMKDLDKMNKEKRKEQRKTLKATLEDRIKDTESSFVSYKKSNAVGSKEATFKIQRSEKESKRKEEQRKHREERLKLRRTAKHLSRIKAKSDFGFNK